MGSGSSRRRGQARRGAAGNRDLLHTVLAECEGGPPPRDIGTAPPELPALSPRSPQGPENNTANHQCPQSNSKKPAEKSTISYDYSEEELMASIEREYCR